jgi:hypothetical protein
MPVAVCCGDEQDGRRRLRIGQRLRAAVMIVALVAGWGQLADRSVARAQGVPDPCDFATGGGFVITDGGYKANFGAHGGCKNGKFWGHVNFVDHTTGYHVSSTEITAYVAPFGVASPVRDICGLARTNKNDDPQPVWFRVRLVDNGEPGSLDQFGIKLAVRTSAEDEFPSFQQIYAVTPRDLSTFKPGAGNVELHDANGPSSIAPLLDDEYTACGGLTFDQIIVD